MFCFEKVVLEDVKKDVEKKKFFENLAREVGLVDDYTFCQGSRPDTMMGAI